MIDREVPTVILEPLAGRGGADPAGELHLAQAPRRADGGEGCVFHQRDLLDLLLLTRSRTVSRRPRTVRRERAAQFVEAAIEGGAGAETAFGEDADRALRSGRAERRSRTWSAPRARARSRRRVDRLLQRDAVAVPGGQAVGLAEPVGDANPSAPRRPETHPPPVARRSRATRVAMREAWLRSTMPAKAPIAAASGIEGRQAPDQVEEEILPQVIEIGARQAERRRRRAAAASASSRMVTRSVREMGDVSLGASVIVVGEPRLPEIIPPSVGSCVGLAWEFRGKALARVGCRHAEGGRGRTD